MRVCFVVVNGFFSPVAFFFFCSTSNRFHSIVSIGTALGGCLRDVHLFASLLSVSAHLLACF